MKPNEALIHFPVGMVKKISKISVGLIHSSFLVNAKRGKFVLQQLHPSLSHPSLTEDYDAVTRALRAAGVECQKVVRTNDNQIVVPDGERNWRLLSFVPGRVFETISSPARAAAAAAAVAQFHAALAQLKYKFQSQLAFHPYNAPKFFKDFQRVVKRFERSPLVREVRVEVREILRAMPRAMLSSKLPRRIVHGDLKITNFVFDESGRRVRAIIDLDTCARFSPLLELGDALRSWCGKREDDPKNVFNIRVYSSAVNAYLSATPKFLSAAEKKLIPRGVEIMILTLAMRFLKDYFEDYYFGWDTALYKTRRQANLARCRGQLALWRDFKKKMK